MNLTEEQKLIEAHRMHDKIATEKLVQSQMKLIRKIAVEYKNFNTDFEDLVQEGVVGLLIALSKFDASLGTRLSTYASHYIRSSIGRAAKDSSLIRQPYNRYSDKITLQRAEEAGMTAEDTGLSERRIRNAKLIEVISIDAHISDDDTVADFIAAPLPDPDYRPAVEIALSMLNDDECELLCRIFGIDREAEHLKRLAAQYDVDLSTIICKRDEALRKLRNPHFLRIIRKELK